MTNEVKALEPFFGLPVAVQLKVPCVMIDNNGESVEADGTTYGVPQLVNHGNGGAALQAILCGQMFAADDGGHVYLDAITQYQAKVRHRLHPGDIQYVTMVLRPGSKEAAAENESRIVRPH